jgi:hypothetical protein
MVPSRKTGRWKSASFENVKSAQNLVGDNRRALNYFALAITVGCGMSFHGDEFRKSKEQKLKFRGMSFHVTSFEKVKNKS